MKRYSRLATIYITCTEGVLYWAKPVYEEVILKVWREALYLCLVVTREGVALANDLIHLSSILGSLNYLRACLLLDKLAQSTFFHESHKYSVYLTKVPN